MNADSVTTDTRTERNGTPLPSVPNPLDEPTFEECHAEWTRYFDTPGSVLDPGHKHPDEFVAFYNGKPVDYDKDPTELQKRAAAVLGIHPARLVIAYLGTYEFILRN